MTSREHPCDDTRLEILLFGDEESCEFLDSASHVESCPHCRDRLTELAAEEQLWSEAGKFLRETGGTAGSTGPNGEDDRGGLAVERQLECLSSPRHPELLGRLGRYDIERVIGTGGMGVVLKGFDTELNRPVAIKLLAPHLAHSGAARQRFTREAKAAAAIVHEHVVAIHNVESDGHSPFLVMQYVAGESLQTRVDREGPLETIDILRIGAQAAAGLAAAHEQGVVHRDIKPANILLEEGIERVLLTDFGLARTVDDASLTHTGVVAGTPHYMSPEQASGEPIDHRTDLFSLGAVLYFMATGRPPFRADQAMGVLHRVCHDRHRPVWQVNPDIPDELSDIIDRLLEKRPGRRYSTAALVRQALLQALNRSQRRGPLVRCRRLIRRHPWLLASTAAAGCGSLTLAFALLAGRAGPADKALPASQPVQPSLAPAWQELAAYAAMLGEAQNELDEIEQVRCSAYLHLADTDWSIELDSLHSQLDQIERAP